MKNWFYSISVSLLLIMHAAGLYGLVYGQTNFYRDLSAFNLALTFFLFVVGGSRFDKPYLLTLITVSAIGLAVEIIGVKTQLVFGHYQYTSILGTPVMNVPVVIGLNWGMLIMSCAAV
ncbi:MAG TPA: carotenoid biosynthesis protein, partial [Flavobacteriales bacterium]|nr:carotenoid biosynthesis protein [Flavobacteriales bacterium]